MSLDIHKNDNDRELLFSLDDHQFGLMSHVFDIYYKQSGINIDYYRDCGLSVDQQKILVKLIDKYIIDTDLNKNKQATIQILSFRGFLLFTIGKDWNLFLYCD